MRRFALPTGFRWVAAAVATVAVALAPAAPAAAQTVPETVFGDRFHSLEDYVEGRLGVYGQGRENAEALAAIRKQRDEGLISDAQYAEAAEALGADPLLLDGRPFTGTVRGEGPGGRYLAADFEEGRLQRAEYHAADGTGEILIELLPGGVRETRYWGGPYGEEPRSVTEYEGRYMGPATTRVTTPSGALIRETSPDGKVRTGEGWMGGVNMWDEDNPFYRRVEACESAKLFVNGSWFEVAGSRAGGCAVVYGHWASPDPARPGMAGTRMTCVLRDGSAYDFVNALHGQGLPNDTCEGPLAELLGDGRAGGAAAPDGAGASAGDRTKDGADARDRDRRPVQPASASRSTTTGG